MFACASVSKRLSLQNVSCENEVDLHENIIIITIAMIMIMIKIIINISI